MEKLTQEQQNAYTAICQGQSIFLTGPGGTGKSFLLHYLYDTIPDITGKHIAITAMTGCAALLIGSFAKTLHSWAGIGLGRESAPVLAKQIQSSRKAKIRWIKTDILVIDEVSMLTPELLEKLDAVAKILRKNQAPMGGLQVVFVGDFYQLPPVNKERNKDTQFLFESPLWSLLVKQTIHLTQILRQSDTTFQKILNEARIGRISKESLEILQGRMDQPWQELVIRPSLLYVRRAEVDMINVNNLNALSTEKKQFDVKTVCPAEYSVKSPEVIRILEKMDRDCSYITNLILCIGAQVMLLTNLDQEAGRVNGSRGVITGFTESGNPIVQFNTGQPIPISEHLWKSDEIKGLARQQIPLALAYAITVHKAQGSTLDCALIDIGTSTFEYGQAYVALSRVKNLESLYVWDVESSAFKAHPKVVKFYESLA